MPAFAYRGRDARGGLVTGRLEGASSGAIADQLLAIGVTPVQILPAGDSVGPAMPEWWHKFTAPPISDVDVMLFSRQMYSLLKAGVPILRALAGLQQSSANRSLAEVIGDLRTSLDAGRELSAAMRGHPRVFGPFYISVIRIGETTGEPIDPMSAPGRFTDPAKVEKWFKRNCSDVLGRECTALEKGDSLAYLLGL